MEMIRCPRCHDDLRRFWSHRITCSLTEDEQDALWTVPGDTYAHQITSDGEVEIECEICDRGA